MEKFKNSKKVDLVKNNKVVIATNANALATNNIIKDWVNQAYVPHFKNIPLQKTLLIWDNSSKHNSIYALKYLYDKI